MSLVFLTTMMTSSSFGMRAYSQRRRQPVALSADHYGISDDASWSTLDPRLSAAFGSSRRTSPASTVLHHPIGDVADMSVDSDQFPVKRRWNSGNLRVWGKRRSPDSRGQTDDRLADKVPFWLLLSARSVNDERASAPAASEVSLSGEARLNDRRAEWDKRQKESIKRSNMQRHFENAPWLS